MKRYILAICLLFVGTLAAAQNSAVTATVVDSDGQSWNNGTYSITFMPPSGYTAGVYTFNGSGWIPPNVPITGTLTNAGVMNVPTLQRNDYIYPLGSHWMFMFCPNASASCSATTLTINQASQNISSTLVIVAPRFAATTLGTGAYGYADSEIYPANPPIGAHYWNVNLNAPRWWNGSAWTSIASGSTGVTQINAGTNVTISPPGGTGVVTINSTGGGSGGNSVQYNPSTTAYVLAGSSMFSDDNHVTSSAVTVANWTCNGTICTVTTSAAHNLVAGNWVQVNTMTGWFPSPTGLSWVDTGVGTFQVLSAGLTSTQFEFAYTANTGSGTGGSIYDADYWGAYMTATEPFFNGHGSLYYRLDSCANDITYFTQKFGNITGSPKYLILAGCQDDIYNNGSVSTIENNLQSLWAQAHANGWIVVQLSQLSSNYGIGAPCATGNPSQCAIQTMQLNGWLPQQGKTFFAASNGKYWDSYIDVAAYQYDWSDGGPLVGNTVSGGKPFAQRLNAAFAAQDSSITGPPPFFHWGGGTYNTSVLFGTANGSYSPPLVFLDKTTPWLSLYTTGNGIDYVYVNNPGNSGPDGNIPSLVLNNSSSPDVEQVIGKSSTPGIIVGEDLNNNNDAGYLRFHYSAVGSTSNYLDLGICTSVTTGWGPLGQACGGTFTDGIQIFPSGNVVLPSVATAPSTSPICPNGTGGALTTVGCASGGGGSGPSDIQITTATTSIPAASGGVAGCDATATTQAWTGLTATMSVSFTPTGDLSGTTGWNTGSIYFDAWPTAGQLNYKRCNTSSSAITPGAVTWNVSAK